MRINRVKTLIFLTLLLSLLISFNWAKLFAENKDTERTEGKIVIEFWHAMKPNNPKGRALTKLVERFNRTHHNIKVIAKFKGTKHGNPYNRLFRELLISLSKGKPPAVAQVYENWTLQFMAAGKVKPIQEFVDNDPEFKAELSDFIEGFYKSNVVNHKLITLPFNKSIWVIYYNGDVFNTFNLKPPSTWEELKKLSKFIYENTDIYGVALYPNVDLFMSVYVTTYREPLFYGLNPTFTSQRCLMTLNYLRELVDNSGAVVAMKDRKMFLNSETAMIITTTSKYEYLKSKASFRVGIAPLPLKDGGYPFAGTNLLIFNEVSPAQQKAAYEFIKWLLKPENLIEFDMATGYIPVRKSALNNRRYQEYLARNPEFKALLDKTLDRLEPQPPIWAWENVRYYLSDAVYNVLVNHSEPRTELQTAQELTIKIVENQKLYNVPTSYGMIYLGTEIQ